MNKAMIGRNTQIKTIKSSKTIRAKKTIEQKIEEAIKRNIDVYIRLRDR